MMHGFYTPSQIAEMRGGGESTWRLRAARGAFKHAYKQGNTWFIPLRDIDKWGRGYDEEFAEPAPLGSDGATDIVLARDSDGRYGIYIEEDWYGAGQALNMLEYLRKYEQWLREKAQENQEAVR